MSQRSQDSAAKQTISKPDLIPAVDEPAPDEPLDPANVLVLQQTVGNQVVRRICAPPLASTRS